MADYYPLLSRAVASLPEQSMEARQAIYSRARDALERQLRGMTPKLSDADIVAELLGLEDVIKRIEQDAQAMPTLEDITASDDPAAATPVTPPDIPPENDSRPLPVMPPSSGDTAHSRPASPGQEERTKPETDPKIPRVRMPDGTSDARQRRRLGLIAILGTLSILGMGLFALATRDGASRYQAANPAAPVPAPIADASKREGRLDGTTPDGGTTRDPIRPAEQPSPPRPDPIPDRPPADTATTPAAPPPGPPPAPPSAPPAAEKTEVLPIAGRSFMILEVPGRTPNQYEGQATWSYSVDPNARAVDGKAPEKMLRATVEFAAAGLTLDFSVARSTDARLQASHVVTLAFDTRQGLPAVREMTAIEWRERESQAGTTFAGTLVPIQDNFFMIGLDRSEAGQARNLDLLRNQRWMVFEIRLASGRRGAFLIEKGSSGEQAVSDALAAWK